ncbi:MAG: site-specific integrase, partial [Clostridia bacterium]
MEKNIDFSKNYFDDSPFYLREFLIYISTILGRSQNTVKGYYTDIKSFLRYVKLRYLNLTSVNFNEININDVSIEMLKTIELLDVYEYLHFCMNDLSNNDKARARKVSALRTFYKYLTVKSNL